MPDAATTPVPVVQVQNPNNWIVELAKAGGLSTIAAVVLWQMTTAFITQSQSLAVTFQAETKTERESHRDALGKLIESNAAQNRLIQESCDRRTDKMLDAVRAAVDELKRTGERMDSTLKNLERRDRGESRITPVPPEESPPVSVAPSMIRTVAHLIAAATIPVTFNYHAPPVLTIPAEVRPVGEYATVKPDVDAVSVTYVGLDGVDGFPSDFLKDARHFVLPVRGLKDGRYRFVAVAASSTGDQARADFTVIVGQGAQPPPVKPTDPPPTKPTDPPPPTEPVGSLFFVVVRPDGAATTDLAKVLDDPEWEAHRKAGRQMKAYTLAELGNRVKVPAGTALPCVITLRVFTDGKPSVVVREPINLPTTSDGIRKLHEGVK